MPRKSRTPEAVEEVRELILDHTLRIISEEGYSRLSMRRIAARLGFAAKTIYNYYSTKDEIYIKVLTRGFELLYERILVDVEKAVLPNDKLRAICRTYVYFGIEHPHYYNIMFNLDVPKYAEYENTLLEPVSYVQKVTALRVSDLSAMVIEMVVKDTRCFPLEDIPFRLLQMWSMLHGIVSLYNSRVTVEVHRMTLVVIDRLLEDIMSPFCQEPRD